MNIVDIYVNACEEVCKKFGTEEKLEYLKKEVKLMTYSELIDEIEHEFEEIKNKFSVHEVDLGYFSVRSIEKLLKKLQDNGNCSYIRLSKRFGSEENNYDYVLYPKYLDQKWMPKKFRHELGHALYYSYKDYDTPDEISELYAQVAEDYEFWTVDARIGEYLLKGLKLNKAIEKGLIESMKVGEFNVRLSNGGSISEKNKIKLFKLLHGDHLEEYHFKANALLKRILEEFENKDEGKILGDALRNPEIDFSDPNRFLETLIENY